MKQRQPNKRILFVTPHYPPSPSVGTQRMIRFMKYLARDGWEVYVLTLKESYFPQQNLISEKGLPKDRIHVFRTTKFDPFVLWDKLKKVMKKKKQTNSENSNKQNTQQPSLPKSRQQTNAKRSVIVRVLDFVTRMMQYPDRENGWVFNVLFHTWRLTRKYQIPVVFASSPPHSPYLALNFLRKILKFQYVVDFRDPWARSQWSKETRFLHEKLYRKLDIHFEKRTIRRADTLIFNNEVLFEEYQRCYPEWKLESKALVLTNGFDPDLTDLDSVFAPRKTRGEDKIVIIHAGTLYKKRDPRNIFEALLKFKSEKPEQARRIVLKFVGHVTPDLHYLYQFVEDHQLNDQIQFLPVLPYEQALNEMMAADWLLILQPVTRIQVPAKFFDYLIIPRPIWGVVEPDSISERLIKQLNIGHVSFNEKLDSILEFFRFVSENPAPQFVPDKEVLQRFMISNIVRQLEQNLLSDATSRRTRR